MAYAHEIALTTEVHMIHHFAEWGLLSIVGVAVYFVFKKFNRT